MIRQEFIDEIIKLVEKRAFKEIKRTLGNTSSRAVLSLVHDIMNSVLKGFVPSTLITSIFLKEVLNDRQRDIYFDHLLNQKSLETLYYYKLFDQNFIIDSKFSKKKSDFLFEEIENTITSIYNDNVEIKIQLSEGSIRTKIALYGSLIYLGIGNYGSFKSGLNEIVKDLNFLADKIIMVVNNIEPKITDQERNIGLPKELLDLMNEIDDLKKNNSPIVLKNNEKYLELNQKLSDLLAIMYEKETTYIIKSIDYRDLPLPEDNGIEYYRKIYGIRDEEDYMN